MSRPANAAILAMAGLAFIAGCSDETSQRDSYIKQVNASQTRFATTVRRISGAITPASSPAQDRRTLIRFEGAVDEVVADLRRIDVPPAVEPEHARLVLTISSFRDDLRMANTALRQRPSRRRLRDAQQTLGRATSTVNARIVAAVGAINKKLGV